MNAATPNTPFAEFDDILTRNKPLAPLNAYRLGGTARLFFEPTNTSQLAQLLQTLHQYRIAWRPLGSGCNLLIATEQLDEAVIALGRLDSVHRDGTDLIAGAGTEVSGLIQKSIGWGLAGLETLAGIPGSLGGFIAMNAGGRHGQIADRLTSVTLVDSTGQITERPAADLKLGYRSSRLEGQIVAAARLSLTPDEPDQIRQRRRTIMEQKAAEQPFADRSAGCVFKNPPSDVAGRLIDAAGLKGLTIGGAAVSEQHANFIVNRGGATAADILALIKQVQQIIKTESGTDLELELTVWP